MNFTPAEKKAFWKGVIIGTLFSVAMILSFVVAWLYVPVAK